ncbi:hypothetical protein F511_38098 [Dorcoceras hygrometricum]|uniref:Uncharacterized protein n=1 Tax=Dorcoceras hygrometricum TaxID=472368 RepID=A0A2Z7A5N2_9LAMI|nr:hypothetical protein F511_38098 [Dorcoceras hygrometricum]
MPTNFAPDPTVPYAEDAYEISCKPAKELRFWSWTGLDADPAVQPLKCQFPRGIGRSQAPRRHQGLQIFKFFRCVLGAGSGSTAAPTVVGAHVRTSIGRHCVPVAHAMPGIACAGRYPCAHPPLLLRKLVTQVAAPCAHTLRTGRRTACRSGAACVRVAVPGQRCGCGF